MPSILAPDPSALSAQSLVLHGRTLDVVRAVTRDEAGKLKEAGEKAREKADKRNMYLLREGGMHACSVSFLSSFENALIFCLSIYLMLYCVVCSHSTKYSSRRDTATDRGGKESNLV